VRWGGQGKGDEEKKRRGGKKGNVCYRRRENRNQLRKERVGVHGKRIVLLREGGGEHTKMWRRADQKGGCCVCRQKGLRSGVGKGEQGEKGEGWGRRGGEEFLLKKE